MSFPKRGVALGIGMLLAALALWQPEAAHAVSDAEFREAEAALKAAPSDGAKRIELAALHYLKGSDFAQSGNAANAVVEFKTALSVLEDRQSKVPEQTPVYEETRYGLGYAYFALGQPQEAVVILDQLVAASPRFARARYLLGIALLRMSSEDSMGRGLEVLMQLAKDTPGPDGTAATHAITRYVYNLAVGHAGIGRPGQALAMMRSTRERIGAGTGADAAENQALLFGMGVFQTQTGNSPAGLSEFEALKAANERYRLKNGLTLQQVLANAYYQAGTEQLSRGGQGALQQALMNFENAERYGTGKETDTHHGKALAYKQLNQQDKMAEELALILKLDREYYKRINTGS
jgi:tetratricopeptide (TPR) repeat protein